MLERTGINSSTEKSQKYVNRRIQIPIRHLPETKGVAISWRALKHLGGMMHVCVCTIPLIKFLVVSLRCHVIKDLRYSCKMKAQLFRAKSTEKVVLMRHSQNLRTA